ncbi:MAG: zeta toxin family protein, partial [Ottowia sp.]|nr:zeta toxin family protein [Ottowia sp.]
EREGFKLQKIGTGDGAQYFGWGMYFASLRRIGEHYRRLYKENHPEREAALYELEIPEDEDLLAWDVPLSQGSVKVQRGVQRALLARGMNMADLARQIYPDAKGSAASVLTGRDIYNALMGTARKAIRLPKPRNMAEAVRLSDRADSVAQRSASEDLLAAGIPGLRYLDETSRGNGSARPIDGKRRTKGDGTHNYVIWDEALLTPEAAQITPMFSRKAARQQREQFFGGRSNEQLMADYDALPEADGGHVINADIARTLSPQYREGSASAADVQDASAELADRLFKRNVARPVAAGRDNVAAFTAGGSGAGKSAAIAKLLGAAQKADIVFDGTFSDADRSVARVKRALESGRSVEVCFVYRTPANAAASVIKRANETGRTVPLATLVKSHAQSLQTVRQVLRECTAAIKSGQLRITAVDNNGASIEDARFFESIDQVPEEAQDAIREQFKQAFDAARAAWAGSDAGGVQRTRGQESQDRKPDEAGARDAGRIPRHEGATVPAGAQGRRARGATDAVSNTLSPALYDEFMGGSQEAAD